MKGTEFNQLVRLYTNTTTATLTAADLVILANSVKNDIASRIKKVKENYFVMIATRDLEADIREYSWPDNMMGSMKYLEAKFNGTDWIKLEPLDVNNYGNPTDETTITSLFSNEKGSAFYLNQRRSFFIYSGTISAVTAGLKLHYIQWPKDIDTDTLLNDATDLSTDPSSTTFGLPVEFHELWAREVSIRWKQSRPTPIELSKLDLSYENDLKEALRTLIPAEDNDHMYAQVPDDTHLQV